MDYVLSPLAAEDLEEIWHHIHAGNPPAADKMILRIFDIFSLLCANPLAGRIRKEILPKVRSLPVMPYLVFYIPTSKRIEIIRVLHGSRDIETLFH